MLYIMKQKLFSWGNDFAIKDQAGNDVFFVDGKVFTLGNQFSFQDMAGNELAYIRQKLLAWGPTYEIHCDNQLAAMVKKELFTFFHCSFIVDVPGPDDLQCQGNFLEYEYEFRRGDDMVARVSKQFFSWTDTYGVEIADGEDDLLLLASTVVIDMCCHDSRNR